jgi:uncharacterized protein involved in response to NO
VVLLAAIIFVMTKDLGFWVFASIMSLFWAIIFSLIMKEMGMFKKEYLFYISIFAMSLFNFLAHRNSRLTLEPKETDEYWANELRLLQLQNQ